jgi:methylmalonyl-CoA/ethylmalonyl-CoA epimerase
MIGRLNHVGIAVPTIEAGLAVWRDGLGGAAGVPFDLPSQGVRVCFVDLPNSQIELIAPLGAESPIHGFLARNPAGGQHHVCFEVDDPAAAIATLTAKGARVLGAPRIGAHGTLVVFLHPKDQGGVLVELMEAPGAGH